MAKAKRRMSALQRKYFGKKRKSPRKAARRNPWPVAGAVVGNPRHKRRRARVHHVARRRHARRNPPGLSLAGFRLPDMKDVLFTGVGFVAPPMVEGFIAGYLPASLQPGSSTTMKYVIHIGSVVGLSMLVGKFVGRSEGRATAIGGGLYIGIQAIKDFAPSTANSLGLSAYVSPTMGRYVDSSQPVFRGLSDGGNVFTRRPFAANAIDASVPARFKRF